MIARAADRWLAAYAKVDATLIHPLDPVTTGQTVAALLRAAYHRVTAGCARRMVPARSAATAFSRSLPEARHGRRTWPH